MHVFHDISLYNKIKNENKLEQRGRKKRRKRECAPWMNLMMLMSLETEGRPAVKSPTGCVPGGRRTAAAAEAPAEAANGAEHAQA